MEIDQLRLDFNKKETEMEESITDLNSELKETQDENKRLDQKLTDLKSEIRQIADRLSKTEFGDNFALDQIQTDLWALA